MAQGPLMRTARNRKGKAVPQKRTPSAIAATKATPTKGDAQRVVDAAPKKSIKGMAPMAKPEVKKAAKKTVKAAKKAVKAAVKTVKKTVGTALKSKNTYTTSGTHAGGRKSSASRPIKKAASLKRARATSLRLQ